MCHTCINRHERHYESKFISEKFLKADSMETIGKAIANFPWVQGVYDSSAVVQRTSYQEVKRPEMKDTIMRRFPLTHICLGYGNLPSLTQKGMEDIMKLASIPSVLGSSTEDSVVKFRNEVQAMGLRKAKYANRPHKKWKSFTSTPELNLHLAEVGSSSIPHGGLNVPPR